MNIIPTKRPQHSRRDPAKATLTHRPRPTDIAIVDAACHLIAFERMEGAKITSISIAIDKAFTAAGHRAPTSICTSLTPPYQHHTLPFQTNIAIFPQINN